MCLSLLRDTVSKRIRTIKRQNKILTFHLFQMVGSLYVFSLHQQEFPLTLPQTQRNNLPLHAQNDYLLNSCFSVWNALLNHMSWGPLNWLELLFVRLEPNLELLIIYKLSICCSSIIGLTNANFVVYYSMSQKEFLNLRIAFLISVHLE